MAPTKYATRYTPYNKETFVDTPAPFAWPNGCQAAISFTFDDGMNSQLETAIPRLEEVKVAELVAGHLIGQELFRLPALCPVPTDRGHERMAGLLAR